MLSIVMHVTIVRHFFFPSVPYAVGLANLHTIEQWGPRLPPLRVGTSVVASNTTAWSSMLGTANVLYRNDRTNEPAAVVRLRVLACCQGHSLHVRCTVFDPLDPSAPVRVRRGPSPSPCHVVLR